MITFYKRGQSGKIRTLEKFENGCWISVVNPDEKTLDAIATDFKLDKELLEEGLDENELPRLDIDENTVYVFVKTIAPGKDELETMLIVLSTNFIMTIVKSEPLFLRDIVNNKEKIVTTQRLTTMLQFLSLMGDEQEKTVHKIIKSVTKRRRETGDLSERNIEKLISQEDFLNNLVSAYYYMNLLYSKMIKRIKFNEENKELLEDLMVESTQGLNTCRTSLKAISNIRDYHSIALTNKLNQTIKVLTIFTIFISIPAAVSSLYGMNVTLPLGSHKFGFWFILLVIAILYGLFFIYMKKRQII